MNSAVVLPSSGIILATVDDISCPRPPTSAPTPCSNGIDVEIQIKTDYYPKETSWILTNKCTGSVTSSPKYTRYVTMHSTKLPCLPAGEYEFTIKDTDGICCGRYGDGSYAIVVDGSTLRSGGVFRSSESTTFGEACNAASEQTSNPTSSSSSDSSHHPTTGPPTSNTPTESPSNTPTTFPPTSYPTTLSPTTLSPTTYSPTTGTPTTRSPTPTPTRVPTRSPVTRNPTRIPTRNPTRVPTRKPARLPTRLPTRKPAILNTYQWTRAMVEWSYFSTFLVYDPTSLNSTSL